MSKVLCPICETPMPANWLEDPQYPFCTKRCKLIDLGRWLTEDYKVESKDHRDRSTPGESGEQAE